jgi:hypothetical protein
MPRPEDPGRPSGFLRDRILCLGFRGVKHVAICIRITRLYQTSGPYGCPCGLCDSLCTLRKGCSMKENSMSVPPATLATGGSLRLTRRGLAPRKMHQASLGALTLALCRRSRALYGRKTLEPPPKPLWRAIMPKLLRAGAGGIGSQRVTLRHFSNDPPPNRTCHFHGIRLSSWREVWNPLTIHPPVQTLVGVNSRISRTSTSRHLHLPAWPASPCERLSRSPWMAVTPSTTIRTP